MSFPFLITVVRDAPLDWVEGSQYLLYFVVTVRRPRHCVRKHHSQIFCSHYSYEVQNFPLFVLSIVLLSSHQTFRYLMSFWNSSTLIIKLSFVTSNLLSNTVVKHQFHIFTNITSVIGWTLSVLNGFKCLELNVGPMRHSSPSIIQFKILSG